MKYENNVSNNDFPPGYVPKSRMVYILLALFLGELGIHEFYRGEAKTGFSILFGEVLSWILLLVGLSTEGAVYIVPLIIILCISVAKFVFIFKFKTDSKGFPMR